MFLILIMICVWNAKDKYSNKHNFKRKTFKVKHKVETLMAVPVSEKVLLPFKGNQKDPK